MAKLDALVLSADRFFNPDPAQRHLARELRASIAGHSYLFRGAPNGAWHNHALVGVFGIRQKRTTANTQALYGEIAAKYGRRNLRRARAGELLYQVRRMQ